MPNWIITLSIGPVGGFIGAGRRSRDLWWGSSWLSECTAAVAEYLRTATAAGDIDVQVFIPTKHRLDQLQKGLFEKTYDGRVSNKILARVTASSETVVRQLVAAAEQVAKEWLQQQLRENRSGTAVRKLLYRAIQGLKLGDRKGLSPEAVLQKLILDEPRFEAQVEALAGGDFLEVYAAWTPVTADAIGAAIRRAWGLLEGRKAARFFEAPAWAQEGARKSDLDPRRDSVLLSASPQDRNERDADSIARGFARRVLGIGPDEHLDALGFARRISAFRRVDGEFPKSRAPKLSPLPFPPIPRVALDPWLKRAANHPEASSALEAIKEILSNDEVQENELFFTWCSPARDPEKQYTKGDTEQLFPYDTSFLMENGLATLHRELRRYAEKLVGPKPTADSEPSSLGKTIVLLGELRPHVEQLYGVLGIPSPYYVLLAMDGDGIGSALEEVAQGPDLVRHIRALDTFADSVERKVRELGGCAFYVGGDDLLAYLPLDRALKATRVLSTEFASVQKVFREVRVSLSGGLVIAHAKDDLRRVRSQAQAALYAAKTARRNSQEAAAEAWLEIREVPRSGQGRSYCGPLTEVIDRFQLWSQGFTEERLSQRSSVLLREFARRFRSDAKDGGDAALEIGRHRITAQRDRSTKDAADQSDPLNQALSGVQNWDHAERLADELQIALRLHRAGTAIPVTSNTDLEAP